MAKKARVVFRARFLTLSMNLCRMSIQYLLHALKRMDEQGITEDMVRIALERPDSIVDGYAGRKIFQRKLNGHILRVVIENGAGIKRVVTVYVAEGARYEI